MEEFVKDIGQEVPPDQAKKVHSTLAKVLDNILRNPCEPKFRTLRKENKVVAETICISMAAVSLLFLVGFEDWDDSYHCPIETDLGEMQAISDLLWNMTMNLEVLVQGAPAVPQQAVLAAPQHPMLVIRRPAAAQSSEAEAQRQAQKQQLQALRAQRHVEHTSKIVINSTTEAPITDLLTFDQPKIVNDLIPIDELDVESSRTQETHVEGACARSNKFPPRTVFDFRPRDRGQPRQEKNSLDDVKRLRQERYKQFQADPDSRLSSAYAQPPTGTYDLEVGDKRTEGWNQWISDASKQLSQAALKTSEQISSGFTDASKQFSQSMKDAKERLSASSSNASTARLSEMKDMLSPTTWLSSFAAVEEGPGLLPARFRVVGMGGVLVRVGIEMDSQPVEMLRQPVEFDGLESRTSSDGILRIRIEEPHQGWISYKSSIIRRVGAESSDETHVAARDVHLHHVMSPALLQEQCQESANERTCGQAGQGQPASKTRSARELHFISI